MANALPQRLANLSAGLLGSLPTLWQLIFFVGPLVFLVALSFWTVKNFQMVPDLDTANWVRVLSQGLFWDAYFRTAALSFGAAALASVIAFPAAYVMAFYLSPRAQRLCLLLLITPFFTSYLVRIYSWQVFFLNEGIINTLLGYASIGPIPFLSTYFATIVGYLTLCLPLVILVQFLSLSNVDGSLIGAAKNLGCSSLRTVFAIILPASRAGLTLAALFAFILSFGDFASPLYLGGGKITLSILITDVTKSGQQWPRAAVIALTMIMTLLTLAFAALTFAYAKRRGVK